MDVNRIRDPPVAAAAVEPVLDPRRVIVRERLHANLPRLTLPAVVSHVHDALSAVAEPVLLVAAVVDDGVVPGLRVRAQPVVHLVHVRRDDVRLRSHPLLRLQPSSAFPHLELLVVGGGVHLLQRRHARVGVDGIRGVGHVLKLLAAVGSKLRVRRGDGFAHRGLHAENLAEELLELLLLGRLDLRGGDGRGSGSDSRRLGRRPGLLLRARRHPRHRRGRDPELGLEERDLLVLLVEQELQLRKLGADSLVAARRAKFLLLRQGEFRLHGVELGGE